MLNLERFGFEVVGRAPAMELDPEVALLKKCGFADAVLKPSRGAKTVDFTFRHKHKIKMITKGDSLVFQCKDRILSEDCVDDFPNLHNHLELVAKALKEVESWPESIEVDDVKFKLGLLLYSAETKDYSVEAGLDLDMMEFYSAAYAKDRRHDQPSMEGYENKQIESEHDICSAEGIKDMIYNTLVSL